MYSLIQDRIIDFRHWAQVTESGELLFTLLLICAYSCYGFASWIADLIGDFSD